jgi:hypothetical protein
VKNFRSTALVVIAVVFMAMIVVAMFTVLIGMGLALLGQIDAR